MELIGLVPALPLLGFLILLLMGKRFSEGFVALTGVGSVCLSVLVALLVGLDFVRISSVAGPQPSIIAHSARGFAFSQTIWTWFSADGVSAAFGLHLDALSLVMVLVITVVAFLIHLYSVRFMSGDEGYSRFFAYMNLFVASMLLLVLADNLLLLYLAWEGVGLCSYLLIGFWYRDSANTRAATKAFMVTRIGDTALVIGLFVLFIGLGTLDIREVGERALRTWPAGSLTAVVAAGLLLAGAVGKSAQLPLQTWLPDAMAGPTPVSALIHAATMVTAGVYLIARMNSIFVLAPVVQTAVAVIGALTLLMAGWSALFQKDIKRVLAYSTMSQVGYMFLALGVGAWSAGIFHFATHAFFKALLFLSAGVVIHAVANEHDIFKMGGLRKHLPLAFWTFIIGAASLSALPFVTSGFYSKEMILTSVWSSPHGGVWLWLAGTAGAFLTSVYAFRVVFIVFFGTEKTPVKKEASAFATVPLTLLALFSLGAGFLRYPIDAVRRALPDAVADAVTTSGAALLPVITSIVSLAGIGVAFLLYYTRNGRPAVRYTERQSAFGSFSSEGWGFDRLYDAIFVSPYGMLARLDRDDFIDLFYRGVATLATVGGQALSVTQSGFVRWYVVALAAGAVIFLGIMVLP